MADGPPQTFPQHASEEEVGISQHLQPDVAGFLGQFKSRWQDFHVHEVDLAGVELHLSELITPGAVAAELKRDAEERREARNALGPDFSFETTCESAMEEALGPKHAQELLSFLRLQSPKQSVESTETPAASPPGFLDLVAAEISDGSKEARKKAHEVLLKHFGSFLNTETVDSSGVRMIRIWMREAEKKAKAPFEELGDKGKDGKGKGKNKSKGKGKKTKGGKGDKGATKKATDEGFGTIRRDGWPKDRPDYLYFRLYKENCDTGEAVSNIARCVGRSVKQFTFAGTKDRRAVTVQQICAHRLPADQLRRTVLHRLWDKRVRISNLEYRADRLRLGQLSGNRFKIVLRNVPLEALEVHPTSKESLVGQAFDAVRHQGFLNYFGLQRFGTRQVKTHKVGAAIIAGKWEEAVQLILGCSIGKRPAEAELAERPSKLPRREGDEHVESKEDVDLDDNDDKVETVETKGKGKGALVSEAQRIYLETGDAQRALDMMPKSQHLERCILGARARGLSCADALSQLPHQAVSLYAHAAQSVIWNAVLSRRIQEFGRRPVAGDLVLDGQSDHVISDQILEEAYPTDDQDDAPDEDVDMAPDSSDRKLPAVRVLTEEDIADAKLSDVVLPLPGFDVVYPKHLQSAYEELSQSLLGLSLADFSACTMTRLTGSYRPIAAMLQDLHWQVSNPEDLAKQTLIESDVARLLAEREPNQQHVDEKAKPDQKTTQDGTAKPEEKPDKQVTGAVTFSCILPPSSYLTMMLRELMKTWEKLQNVAGLSGDIHFHRVAQETKRLSYYRRSRWQAVHDHWVY